jgi:hypothetical protein
LEKVIGENLSKPLGDCDPRRQHQQRQQRTTISTEGNKDNGSNRNIEIYPTLFIVGRVHIVKEKKKKLDSFADDNLLQAKMVKDTWPKTQHKNDGLSKYGGRDLLGYGNQTPNFKWPKGAKVALSFVINYEEGGECVFFVVSLVVAASHFYFCWIFMAP